MYSVIPLSPLLMNYDCKLSNASCMDEPIKAHDIIRNSGMGERLLVKSQLKYQAFEKSLHNYWDRQLINLIKYGFPLDFNRNHKITSTEINHTRAI